MSQETKNTDYVFITEKGITFLSNSSLIPKDVSNGDFIESSFDFTPAKALKSESPLLLM